jgi:hypothetical protein
LRLRLPTPGSGGLPPCTYLAPGSGELRRFPNQMPPRALTISMSQCRFLCVAVFAPCGLLLPRVAVPCVPSAALSNLYVCRASAVRHGYKPRRLGHIRPWDAGLCIPHVFCSWVPPPQYFSWPRRPCVLSFGLFFVLLVVYVRRSSTPPFALAVAAVPLGISSL